MNNTTLNLIVKLEEDYVKNADSLDALLDTEDKQKAILTLEKAQKLEHEERKLKLEESKQAEEKKKLEDQKLFEIEKFEYQKKRDKKDNLIKIILGGLTAAGGILVGVAKLIQVHNQREYVREAYEIDQVTTLTSKTARDLLSDGTNPKI